MNPGWYSDPNGGSDLRWWDGSAWTDHTSPPLDAAPVGAPPGGAPPFPAPSPGVPGGFPPQPQQGGSNRNVLIVAGAIVAAVLIVGGAAVFSGGDDDSAQTTTTTTEADTTTTTETDETTTTTAPPADSELVSSNGLSFTRLPDPWEDWATGGRGEIHELEDDAGQFVVVQEQAPSGGQWIGNLLIGDLADTISYTGDADLATATQDLSAQLIASYYVEGSQSSIVRETDVTIDGHPGYFMHHELTFAQEGLETTREKVVVVVIETGQSRPSVFYASIPYNRIDLNEGMDEVYSSLRVND